MSLFLEIVKDKKEVAEKPPEDEVGPATPDGWSVGHLADHGLILSCDGFQLKLDADNLQKLYDIAESGEPGEIHDQNGDLVLLEPTSNSIVMTRTGDDVYPSGLTVDMDTLKELGIEEGKPEDDEESEAGDVTIAAEGVKTAFRRAGKKIKKGFRVTSGYRKGRIVAKLSTAFKPRAKASTRMKLSIAGRKKKLVRVLKSKRTRKKSLSKRLARMNSR